MQLHVLLLVLLAAIMHAAWNALVKSGRDRVLTMALVTAVGSVVAAGGLPFVPLPARASWPFLLLSGVIHIGYYYFLLQAYRVGDLSHVYPVARGAAPLFVAVGAALFAAEPVSPRNVIALAVVSVAIASFAFERAPAGGRDPRPFLYGLGTALIISAYTVVDGLGVRRSGHALAYIVWLLALDGIPLTLYALVTRRARIAPYVRAHWAAGLVGGLMAPAAYGLVVWALSSGGMAYVSALRETSVVFAALIGSTVLREPFGARRLFAAALVAVGIVVMNLGG